ncbi:hypothetical protein AAE478_002254 [Parahypoxylon ruwenzoriense]
MTPETPAVNHSQSYSIALRAVKSQLGSHLLLSRGRAAVPERIASYDRQMCFKQKVLDFEGKTRSKLQEFTCSPNFVITITSPRLRRHVLEE